MTTQTIRWDSFETSVGRIYAAASELGLCRLTWHVRDEDQFVFDLRQRFPSRLTSRDADSLEPIGRQLNEYFAGRRPQFDIPIDHSALTGFERSVLEETRKVPFGSTVTYREIASRIERPSAARAVGNALRNNPTPLVIPCHRIIRSDGSLGGYAGPDGTAEKRQLLHLETQH